MTDSDKTPPAPPTTEPAREILVRVDPKIRRSVDGTANLGMLRNADPNRHYVLVNKADLAARGTYDAKGYRIERYTNERGVHPAGVFEFRPGDVIDVLDAYLMSIDNESKAEMEKAGREAAMKIAKQISAPGGRAPFGNLPRGALAHVEVADYKRRDGSRLGAEHGEA